MSFFSLFKVEKIALSSHVPVSDFYINAFFCWFKNKKVKLWMDL